MRSQNKEILEQLEKNENLYLDKTLGCLLGGAAGDALGYAVEFLSEDQIFSIYGKNGITEFDVDTHTGKALVSDDTQMTLFTATGIMLGDTGGHMRGIAGRPYAYVDFSYRDWLITQTHRSKPENSEYQYSWLKDVPELYTRRAPGNTCLSALSSEKRDAAEDAPINDSKGCGAIMRIAPLALYYNYMKPEILDQEATFISKITHGHPLGYLPSAVVNHMIYEIMYGDKKSLKDIAISAKNAIVNAYKDEKHIDELSNIIDLAMTLSENNEDDLSNIHKIGEGWVAEETLGIALYCSLRYEKDFSKALIASVNHNGDSDSTGAVTGNILGAYLGYQSIDKKWIKDLELKEVIMEIAIDLCHKCQIFEYGEYRDPYWEEKYICNRRIPPKEAIRDYQREFILSEKYKDLNEELKEYDKALSHYKEIL